VLSPLLLHKSGTIYLLLSESHHHLTPSNVISNFTTLPHHSNHHLATPPHLWFNFFNFGALTIFLHYITLHDSSSWQGMIHRKICKGSPQRNVPNEGGLGFSAIFDQYVVTSRKRCILDTKLLCDGNRKPYAGYQMASVSMTLSDPWPGFQGHDSFKRRVSPKRRILQTRLLYRT